MKQGGHTDLSRRLRRDETPQEKRFWQLVRNRKLAGLKFRRQVPIGRYIVDFCCLEKKLIVELDGGGHATNELQEYDGLREAFLESEGFVVVRFWNNEVDENLEGVLEKLEETVSTL